MKYEMNHIQGAMGADDNVSREHFIVESCRQESNEGACIYGLVEIISKVYNSAKERHKKEIVALLHVENFEVNGIREAFKDFPVVIQIVRVKSNDSVKKNGYRKLPGLLKK